MNQDLNTFWKINMILKSVHTGSIAANYKMSLYFLRVGQMPVAKFSTSLKMFSHRKGVSDYAASLAQEVVNVTRKRDVMVDSVPVNDVATLIHNLDEMGFSSKEITQLLCGRTWLLRGEDVLLKTAQIVLQHGLGTGVVSGLIEKLPYDIYNSSYSLSKLSATVDESLVKLRSYNMFSEETLRVILTKNPLVLVKSVSDVVRIHGELRELFTKDHASLVIKKSPNVLIDSWEETNKKFNYAYFDMVYHQKDIVHSRLFSHTFEHIQDRHLFIFRSGHFKRLNEIVEPHLNTNPSLKDVVDSPLSKFVKMCGVNDIKEFYAFENIREIEREDENTDENDSDISDEEDMKIIRKAVKKKRKRKSNY